MFWKTAIQEWQFRNHLKKAISEKQQKILQMAYTPPIIEAVNVLQINEDVEVVRVDKDIPERFVAIKTQIKKR